MTSSIPDNLADVIGPLPYRIALAGGWIDQPFVSSANPDPPGSMVVVQVAPSFRWMDRSGICSSTRRIALELWGGAIPDRDRPLLVRELYTAENAGNDEPSGSQDMVGLVYPGINRLDYRADVEGGVFPAHIESSNDPDVAGWLSSVIHVLPVAPRPTGYSPLGRKNLNPDWIARLGRSGKHCFQAIESMDLADLGDSMNECMACWETILPDVLDHRSLTIDLRALWNVYRKKYSGAMYSGCGGGYLFVAGEEPVPGAFRFEVKIDTQQ